MRQISPIAIARWALVTSCVLCGSLTPLRADDPKPDETKPKKGPECVYVPTPHDIVEKMLEMAKVRKDDVIYDLGCGDGRIVVQAAKKRGCRGVGFEIVPELAQKARESAKENGVSHLVTIKEEDLFEADMSEATVLPMYLLPGMLDRLKPKVKKLKAGTRIISHDYRFENVTPDKVKTLVSKETGAEHILILYTLPLKEVPATEDEEE